MSTGRTRWIPILDTHEGARMSRRSFVTLTALVAGGAAVGALHAGPARAQAKVSKEAMKYQDTPNAGKQCSGCAQFIPGATATADGTCKVVEGSISPHGYCIAWVAKPK